VGHLDIVERAARLFDEVVVAVGVNASKHRLFGADERIAMLQQVCADIENVRVEGFSDLLTEYCREQDAQAVVKGLRAGADFDYELQMAQMNQSLSGIDTFFLATSPQYSFLSSSLVREVARYGGDVSSLVPPIVAARLDQRFKEAPPA
jgi:pantetheine-phosphate adenylyltransferase